MGYTAKYDEKKYQAIVPITGRLETLGPGERMTVGPFKDERQLRRLRYLFYDWLSHLGLKEQYRVRTYARALELEVEDLRWPNRLEVTMGKIKKHQEAPLKELVLADDPERVIQEWIKEEKITTQDGAVLLGKLEEILS